MTRDGGTTPAERDEAQRQLDLAAARHHTSDLRLSTQPRWERVRTRLAQAGIAPEDAAIARKNTEDSALEFVVLVARDGRGFSFEFDWLRDEEGRGLSYEDARVSEWEELDKAARETYAPELEVGREVLEGEAPAG